MLLEVCVVLALVQYRTIHHYSSANPEMEFHYSTDVVVPLAGDVYYNKNNYYGVVTDKWLCSQSCSQGYCAVC